MFANLMLIAHCSMLFALLLEAIKGLYFFVVSDKTDGLELISILKWFILNLVAISLACVYFGFERGFNTALRIFGIILFLSTIVVGVKFFQTK